MHGLPPLNGLRAFEAAARHLSLTKAAAELNVSPGAISHQIRGLEVLLGVQLFERRVRAIVLTAAGKLLYPGVQTGFVRLREAVAGLKQSDTARVLVVSTPPGLTAKWLAPRLYRFANAHPEIDTRISSSLNNANFTTDGVHVAIRPMAEHPAPDPALDKEKPCHAPAGAGVQSKLPQTPRAIESGRAPGARATNSRRDVPATSTRADLDRLVPCRRGRLRRRSARAHFQHRRPCTRRRKRRCRRAAGAEHSCL